MALSSIIFAFHQQIGINDLQITFLFLISNNRKYFNSYLPQNAFNIQMALTTSCMT